jgi:DNA-binding GntR family transcriptional regulator
MYVPDVKNEQSSHKNQSLGLLHKSLVQTIVENIEDRILCGELRPGERLTEQSMCDLLEVSRSPLREAFRILENQGFLENKARKGVFVAKLNRKDAIDIYIIRANLESLATFLAVEKNGPKLAEDLRPLHEKMKKSVTDQNLDEYQRYNAQFHQTLIAACGNGILADMLERFDKQTMRYRLRILCNEGRLEESLKNHDALIRSIEIGDAAAAEKTRKEAILNNIALVEKTFDNDEEEEENLK